MSRYRLFILATTLIIPITACNIEDRPINLNGDTYTTTDQLTPNYGDTSQGLPLNALCTPDGTPHCASDLTCIDVDGADEKLAYCKKNCTPGDSNRVCLSDEICMPLSELPNGESTTNGVCLPALTQGSTCTYPGTDQCGPNLVCASPQQNNQYLCTPSCNPKATNRQCASDEACFPISWYETNDDAASDIGFCNTALSEGEACDLDYLLCNPGEDERVRCAQDPRFTGTTICSYVCEIGEDQPCMDHFQDDSLRCFPFDYEDNGGYAYSGFCREALTQDQECFPRPESEFNPCITEFQCAGLPGLTATCISVCANSTDCNSDGNGEMCVKLDNIYATYTGNDKVCMALIDEGSWCNYGFYDESYNQVDLCGNGLVCSFDTTTAGEVCRQDCSTSGVCSNYIDGTPQTCVSHDDHDICYPLVNCNQYGTSVYPCETDELCVPFLDDNDEDTGVCAPLGTVLEGEPCKIGGGLECAENMACLNTGFPGEGSVCYGICSANGSYGNYSCTDNTECTDLYDILPDGSSFIAGSGILSICVINDNCNLIGAVGCPSGQTCLPSFGYFYKDGDPTRCAPEGPQSIGDTCSPLEINCNAGQQCMALDDDGTQWMCIEMCEPGVTNCSEDIPSGYIQIEDQRLPVRKMNCFDLQDLGAGDLGYGACLPFCNTEETTLGCDNDDICHVLDTSFGLGQCMDTCNINNTPTGCDSGGVCLPLDIEKQQSDYIGICNNDSSHFYGWAYGGTSLDIGQCPDSVPIAEGIPEYDQNKNYVHGMCIPEDFKCDPSNSPIKCNNEEIVEYWNAQGYDTACFLVPGEPYGICEPIYYYDNQVNKCIPVVNNCSEDQECIKASPLVGRTFPLGPDAYGLCQPKCTSDDDCNADLEERCITFTDPNERSACIGPFSPGMPIRACHEQCGQGWYNYLGDSGDISVRTSPGICIDFSSTLPGTNELQSLCFRNCGLENIGCDEGQQCQYYYNSSGEVPGVCYNFSSCDPIDQQNCPDGSCTVWPTIDGTPPLFWAGRGFANVCEFEGLGDATHGQECDPRFGTLGGCEAGLTCSATSGIWDYNCGNYCEPATGSGCQEGETCLDYSEWYNLPEGSIGYCQRQCDPSEPSGTGCGNDQACYPGPLESFLKSHIYGTGYCDSRNDQKINYAFDCDRENQECGTDNTCILTKLKDEDATQLGRCFKDCIPDCINLDTEEKCNDTQGVCEWKNAGPLGEFCQITGGSGFCYLYTDFADCLESTEDCRLVLDPNDPWKTNYLCVPSMPSSCDQNKICKQIDKFATQGICVEETETCRTNERINYLGVELNVGCPEGLRCIGLDLTDTAIGEGNGSDDNETDPYAGVCVRTCFGQDPFNCDETMGTCVGWGEAWVSDGVCVGGSNCDHIHQDCSHDRACFVDGGTVINGIRYQCADVAGTGSYGALCSSNDDCGTHNGLPLVCHNDRCTTYCEDYELECSETSHENGQWKCIDISKDLYSEQTGLVKVCQQQCNPNFGSCTSGISPDSNDYLACTYTKDSTYTKSGKGLCYESATNNSLALGCDYDHNTCNNGICVMPDESFTLFTEYPANSETSTQQVGRCLKTEAINCSGNQVTKLLASDGTEVCVLPEEICTPDQPGQCQASVYNGRGICIPLEGYRTAPQDRLKGLCVLGCNGQDTTNDCGGTLECRGLAQIPGECTYMECDPTILWSSECNNQKCKLYGKPGEYWSGGGIVSRCIGSLGDANTDEVCTNDGDCRANLGCVKLSTDNTALCSRYCLRDHGQCNCVGFGEFADATSDVGVCRR